MLKKADQTTIIKFSRIGDKAHIWTSDKTIMTKLDKIYKRSNEHFEKNKLYAVEYIAEKKKIRFSKPKEGLNEMV